MWKHHCEHRRYVLGVTSVWLLLPVLAAMRGQSSDSALLPWLACLTLVTCATSTVFWNALGTNREALWYGRDKACARVQFVSLFLAYALHLVPRPVGVHHVCTTPLLVLACFAASRWFECRPPQDALATASHLLFRFLGFWWTYLALTPAVDTHHVALCSGLYWMHALYTVLRTGRMRSFCARCPEEYCRGCLEVATLAVLAGLAS